MTASFLTYPLDLIRTILSIQVHENTGGIMETGKMIVRNEGFFGLYKGLFASLIGITPYIGFNMASFDLLKNYFLPDKSSPWFNFINLSLGATAGTIAVTLTYPTDLIRRKIQLMGMEGYEERYSGMWDATVKTYRAEGFYGLYKGLYPCYLKVIPMTALLFMSNEFLKKHIGI